jgi:tRNA(fMet)-specific endonuclease VapC
VILLDTTVAVTVINKRSRLAETVFRQRLLSGETIALSSIVILELEYGIARSARKRENVLALASFLDAVSGVIDFDAEDAAVAGSVRAALAAAGTPISPYDVLIGAQALRRGATLVTANTREFARIKGLTVEDWTAG